MRVTRLEIFGFKSFVERFVLTFDKNTIGIVGPNGSGKSNIVDALRWVLGETQAKQLRGGTFEDLIFNGSETRRPLGMAEVSLTIRPDSGWEQRAHVVAEPLALVRDAAPENGNGSGLAQEPTEELLSADAELTSGEPQQNGNLELSPISAKVLEIPGLFDSAEIQFTRRLYRSGESEYFINRVPARLRDMIDIYRLIGLGARGLSIVQQGQIGQLISKKPAERRELLEEAAGISGFRAKMEAAQRKLDRTNENLSRLTDILIEVEKQLKTLKRQAQRARSRQELKDELLDAELGLFEMRSTRLLMKNADAAEVLGYLQAEVQENEGRVLVQEASQSELQAQIQDLDVRAVELRRERDEQYRILHEERARVQEFQVELARVESKRKGLQREQEQLASRRVRMLDEKLLRENESLEKNERAKVLENEETAAKTTLEEIQERGRKTLEEFSATVTGLFDDEGQRLRAGRISEISLEVERLPDVENELRRVEAELNGARRESEEQRQAQEKLERSLSKIESEQQAIGAQLEALSEHVLKRTSGGSELERGGRVLASALRVSERLQRALQAVLGERGNYLIAPDASERLRAYARNLGGKDSGERLGVLEQSLHAGGQRLQISAIEREKAPSVRLLLEELSIDEDITALAEILLGHVLVVETVQEALELRAAHLENGAHNILIVTETGELVSTWGWCTTEGKGLTYSFTRRIEELQGSHAALAQELENSKTQSEIAKQRVQELIEARNLHSQRREAILQLQKEVNNRLREQAQQERQIQEDIRKQERQARERFLNEERASQAIWRRASEERSRVLSDMNYLAQRLERISEDLLRLDQEENQRAQEIEEIIADEDIFRAQVQEQVQSLDSSGASSQASERIKALEAELNALDSERKLAQSQLGEISQTLNELRKEKNQAQDKERALILQTERSVIELQMLFEEIQRHYEGHERARLLTVEEAEQLAGTFGENFDRDLAGAHERANQLRKRLEREGEVDPQAIELYETEQTRFDNLKTQEADLRGATQTLERTIRQLKELSRIRFLETFTEVNAKFQELVPRLFGGGAGHLELIAPDDPLTSGVEIVVRPPGKRITTMELLSGGEKALVATAVLVAMFLHKPGPICVLDEVDAPLDDANLGRFLELILEISARTQFLVITHNKLSMQSVEKLIGVTMQESGVTTALSVSLEQAEEELKRHAVNA